MDDPLRNSLLAALPPDEFGSLAGALELVRLVRGAVLEEPDQEIEHVYFPTEGVASIVARPCVRRCTMQSVIQSTCCSIDTIMLLSTDGLPGPVMVNRFGNPATVSPR